MPPPASPVLTQWGCLLPSSSQRDDTCNSFEMGPKPSADFCRTHVGMWEVSVVGQWHGATCPLVRSCHVPLDHNFCSL